MNRLIITADLGRLKIYRITQETPEEKPSIDLEADHDFSNDHSRFENRDTDSAGRFPQGGSSQTQSGMSYGERHGEIAEAEKSQLQRIAGCINEAVAGEEGLYLAAPQTIHRRLIDSLDQGVQDTIIEVLPLDLNKAEKLDLLRRFNLI